MENLKEMKQWLKENGAAIRETRQEIKNLMRAGNYAGNLQWKLPERISEYRHNHIAYSMARGKDYKDIEKKIRKGNEPNWGIINELLFKLTPMETAEEAS